MLQNVASIRVYTVYHSPFRTHPIHILGQYKYPKQLRYMNIKSITFQLHTVCVCRGECVGVCVCVCVCVWGGGGRCVCMCAGFD